MGIDPITLALVAGEVMSNLAKNGQIGYTNKEMTMLANVTDGEFVEGAYTGEVQFLLSAEKSYVVTWNSKKYKCEATFSDEDDTPVVYIGNPAIVGELEDNGMPFVVFTFLDESITEIHTLTTGGHSFTVEEITETIVPIDPKYLPAGGGGNAINFAKDYGSTGEVLNGTILELAMGGGGVVTYEQDAEALWADIIAKQPTQMVLNTGIDVRIGVDMLCAGETIASDNWFISGSGAMAYHGMNLKVTCILSATNGGSGVVISVLSEPITFPSGT